MAATRPSLSTLFDSPKEHLAAQARRAADTRAAIAAADATLLALLDDLKATFGARLTYLNLPGLQIGKELEAGVVPVEARPRKIELPKSTRGKKR